jgi:hypothetical protein
VFNGCLQQIQGAIDEHLNRLARRLGAPGYSQGGLVEYVIDTFRGAAHKGRITYITLHDADTPLTQSPFEISPGSADEVVDNSNLGSSRSQKLIDNGASDEAGSTRH